MPRAGACRATFPQALLHSTLVHAAFYTPRPIETKPFLPDSNLYDATSSLLE